MAQMITSVYDTKYNFLNTMKSEIVKINSVMSVYSV